MKRTLAAGLAVLVFDMAVAEAARLPVSQPPAGASAALPVARKNNVIPANCTMDPFKHVYVCCTQDSSGQPVCTEHPLDTKWPLRMQQLQQTQPQTPPMILDPGASQ